MTDDLLPVDKGAARAILDAVDALQEEAVALLASLVGDGVLALDDEIGRWLDAGPNGNITLEQLATHTSGLPRLAPNQPTDEANPYRDFTAERAEEGLRTADRAPDAGHLYSNFGYQLLGLVLERASGQSYQDLLAERLLDGGEDPDPERVKSAAPPLGSVPPKGPGWRLPWDTFVGTKQASDTMPVFASGSTRTYHPVGFFPHDNRRAKPG